VHFTRAGFEGLEWRANEYKWRRDGLDKARERRQLKQARTPVMMAEILELSSLDITIYHAKL